MPHSFDSFTDGDIVEAHNVAELHSPVQDLESGAAHYRADSGSANTYQVSFASDNAFSAYNAGMIVNFKAANANTGASTMEVTGPSGSLGAKPIKKNGATDLESGDVQANQMVALIYNDHGTGHFDLVGLSPSGIVSLARGGSGSDLSASGPGFLKQASSGAGVSVASLSSGDIPNLDASKINSGSLASSHGGMPVGAVMAFAGSSAPSGWLLCFGQSLSTTTYASLFAAIGSAFGGSEGSFSLPDLRGRVTAGKDDMGGTAASILSAEIAGTTLGAVSGTEDVTLTTGQIPSHSHSVAVSGSAGTGAALTTSGTGTTSSGDAGGGGAHSNLQPSMILNFIIYAGV